jgi:hypothetical protein
MLIGAAFEATPFADICKGYEPLGNCGTRTLTW